MLDQQQNIMRALRDRFDGKLTVCKVYDGNVMTMEAAAGRPWRLTPVSGEPFSERLRLRYDGRKVVLLWSSEFVCGQILGHFLTRPFSINNPLKVGFQSKLGDQISAANRKYDVFTEHGKVSAEQKSALRSSELIDVLKTRPLQDQETIYFSKGEVGFYLREPTTDAVTDMIYGLTALAKKIDVDGTPLNWESLPSKFWPLIPLIEKWAIGDDSDREDMLSDTPDNALTEFVQQVEPYLEFIGSYLSSFGSRNPSEEASALATLAECTLEAKALLRERRNASFEQAPPL